MNQLNHFLFSIACTILFLDRLNVESFLIIIAFAYLVNDFISFFHERYRREEKPWYHKRTWIEEIPGLILIGIPLAYLLSFINAKFFWFVLIPYLTHILCDYLCIFEATPFDPFIKWKKKEGWGIFIPDDLIWKSENSVRWAHRVKVKKLKGISENYFTPFAILFLLFSILTRI